jgi:hypothetical protein
MNTDFPAKVIALIISSTHKGIAKVISIKNDQDSSSDFSNPHNILFQNKCFNFSKSYDMKLMIFSA